MQILYDDKMTTLKDQLTWGRVILIDEKEKRSRGGKTRQQRER